MSASTFFLDHPVFTRDEFRSHLVNAGGEPRTADSLLRYHAGCGHLVRVRRGLYAVVREAAAATRFHPDPLLIAAHAAPDAVLSHVSALQLLGVLSFFPSRATFLTETDARRFSYRRIEYVPVRARHSRVRPGTQCGPDPGPDEQIETTWRSGVQVSFTSCERTVVDVLDRSELCGGLTEVWRSLDLIAYLDVRRAITYATAVLGSRATCSRLGFALERRRLEWNVTEEDLSILSDHAARTRTTFPGVGAARVYVDPRWHVEVPAHLIAGEHV